MTNPPRRLLFFGAAFIGALGLLAALLLLFTQSSPPSEDLNLVPTMSATRDTESGPQSATNAPGTAAPASRVVATVDDEAVYSAEWQRAAAVDQVMSGLAGQTPPSPEETLNRLINERLVLRAAKSADLPEADEAEAEAWLTGFLANLSVDEQMLEQALGRVDLSRADLLSDVLPRLLSVQHAIDDLAPDGDEEAWVADLRREAKVVLLESVSDVVASDEATPVSPSPSPAVATSVSASFSTGPQVGDRAPDFSLGTADGATVRLADLGGQPVILNFWATWCAPCREELPLLEATGDEELVVLPIAVRERPEKVTAFAAELGLELPLFLDLDGQVSEIYQVHGLPTSLFVDRQGMVVARHVGPLDQETLDGYLDALLTAPLAPTPTP